MSETQQDTCHLVKYKLKFPLPPWRKDLRCREEWQLITGDQSSFPVCYGRLMQHCSQKGMTSVMCGAESAKYDENQKWSI